MPQEGLPMKPYWLAIGCAVFLFGVMLLLVVMTIEPDLDVGNRATVLPTNHVEVKSNPS
jgi:hypothetical protein